MMLLWCVLCLICVQFLILSWIFIKLSARAVVGRHFVSADTEHICLMRSTRTLITYFLQTAPKSVARKTTVIMYLFWGITYFYSTAHWELQQSEKYRDSSKTAIEVRLWFSPSFVLFPFVHFCQLLSGWNRRNFQTSELVRLSNRPENLTTLY
jgi:hypothetical protein